MKRGSAQLARLIDELQEVNRQLVEAARPLEGLPDLNLAQRQSLGDQIRAGLARWENVRQRIAEVLEHPAEDGRNQDG
jgi:hypothetical protein